MTIRESYEKREQSILSKYAIKSTQTKGREHPISICDIRTEFQRDRDRIIHSKSFRRLKSKTQVFMSAQGDHYRTRLTHTLEVSQIARTISRALMLNEDLTEAIALGHDLGHTPFGHCGETTLNLITPFGFKHYEHSVRVAQVLENDFKGLNLTYEVIDGIRNHSGENVPSTLEGQVVKLSDKIAYVNHDIDDAIRCGVLKKSDLPRDIIDALGDTHGDRIQNLVLAVIENSADKPSVSMEPGAFELMMKLRAFMFEHVYKHPFAVEEEKKATHILCELYEHFIDFSYDLPYEFQRISEKESAERAVCDYIAGMTDQYAISVFSDKVIPHAFSGR